ncbi:hypothetical protein A2U01_0071423 [Trifolium medium]|uniref:Uncharacterized protein n=1 Tax=Trifolium medium TaxID=97028 RepID=A0A392SNC8_9FABA|nr:hypothetical protein [Trifolium medium]
MPVFEAEKFPTVGIALKNDAGNQGNRLCSAPCAGRGSCCAARNSCACP